VDLTEREVDGASVMTLAGRLTVNDQANLLKSAVAAAAERGTRHVVLDLGAVKYIDSTRLGELIAAHVTLSRLGGRLCLAAVPPRVTELLGMAGLEGVFSRYPTVAQALADR
jgi:anti-sigma B factor antagonist